MINFNSSLVDLELIKFGKLLNLLMGLLGTYLLATPMVKHVEAVSPLVKRATAMIETLWIMSLPENKKSLISGEYPVRIRLAGMIVVFIRYFGGFLIAFATVVEVGLFEDPKSAWVITCILSLPLIFILNSFPAFMILLRSFVRTDTEKRIGYVGLILLMTSMFVSYLIG